MLSTAIIGVLAMALPAVAVDNDTNPTLNNQLFNAVTMLNRWNILNNTSGNPWKYDFATNPQWQYRNNPGSVCNANKATWPALQDMEATVAQLNLGACSMLPPHLHRCSNVVVAIEGTTHTIMIQENGVDPVEEDLSPGQATIFPKASMHTMFNNGCTPNQLYSFLPCGDPSTLNVMNNMMALGQVVGQVIMPWMTNCSNVQAAGWNATKAQVPPIGSGSNAWTQECLTRCGITSPGTASRRFVKY